MKEFLTYSFIFSLFQTKHKQIIFKYRNFFANSKEINEDFF